MNGTLVYRAEKKSLQFKSTTGQEVGPGSYGADAPPSPSALQAPFLTAELRILNENKTTSNITPGPGSYSKGHDSVVNGQVGGGRNVSPHSHASSFISNTSRFHTDKSTPAQNPGPGTYAGSPSWVKENHRYTSTSPLRKSILNLHPNPPSIPAQHQSYGYDEGANGEMVMQPIPVAPHTGEGFDRVGPTDYEPPLEIQPAQKAPSWSKSKARRGDIAKRKETPGPGAYNPAVPAKTTENVININGYVFGYGSGTSSFASKAALAHQKVPQDFEILPGPGSYTPQVSSLNVKGAPPPKELQTFGTRQARDYQVDPSKIHHTITPYTTPGPGQYDEARKTKVKKSFSADSVPFNTQSNRFSGDETLPPGPGQYQAEAVTCLQKDVETKSSICRSGIFGTLAPRFQLKNSQYVQLQQPGPGNYNPKTVSKPGAKKTNAVFASKSDRFRPETAPPAALDVVEYDGNGPVKGDPARLGPGAYSLPDNWNTRNQKGNYLGYRKPGFMSESNRFKEKVDPNPGPGVYDNAISVKEAFRPITVPNQKSAFGVQVGRFGAGKTYTPGPGYYEADSDIVKKSYNITVDGVVS